MYHYDDPFSTRPTRSLEDNIRRFRKFGTIITRVAKNKRGEIARIGKIERGPHDHVFIIFYPNGDYDRFEPGEDVEYRTGWKGPDLEVHVDGDDIAEILMGVADEMNGIATKKVEAPKKSSRKMTDAQRAAKNARARERYRQKKEAAEKPSVH